jgi:hypothetical protein
MSDGTSDVLYLEYSSAVGAESLRKEFFASSSLTLNQRVLSSYPSTRYFEM